MCLSLLADLADRYGLMELLKRYFAAGLRRLRKLSVDGGYRGYRFQDVGFKFDADLTKLTWKSSNEKARGLK